MAQVLREVLEAVEQAVDEARQTAGAHVLVEDEQLAVGDVLEQTVAVVREEVVGVADLALVEIGSVGHAEVNALFQTLVVEQKVAGLAEQTHGALGVEGEAVGDCGELAEAVDYDCWESTEEANVVVGKVVYAVSDGLGLTGAVGVEVESADAGFANVEVGYVCLAVGNGLRSAGAFVQVIPVVADETCSVGLVSLLAVGWSGDVFTNSIVSSVPVLTLQALIDIRQVPHTKWQ